MGSAALERAATRRREIIALDIPRSARKSRRRPLWITAAVVSLGAVTMSVGRLRPAGPVVDASAVWTGVVERGEMVREVRGSGSLVPERVRWISAVTAGRVESILARPGMEMTAGTEILVLANPDVELQALEARRQLAAAEAELVSLQATLEGQRLDRAGVVATVEREHAEALRQAEADSVLAARQLIPGLEAARSRDRARELATRLDLERERLGIQTRTVEAQLRAQRAQVERLRGLVALREEQVAALHVRAGAGGILQELDLQVGQWVQAGELLTRVAEPGRLKAELQVPETRAGEVAVGQSALIDTRGDTIRGRVIRVNPSAQGGNVLVEVALEGELPRGARPDIRVDGTIEIERLADVLHVPRPAYGQANSAAGVFRVAEDGREAVRTAVRLGRSSVNTIEVADGLREGDRIILSDMSRWESEERVRLR